MPPPPLASRTTQRVRPKAQNGPKRLQQNGGWRRAGGQEQLLAAKTEDYAALLLPLSSALEASDADEAWAAWSTLMTPESKARPTLEQSERLARLLHSVSGYDHARHEALARHVLALEGTHKSLSRCLAIFFRAGQAEQAFAFVRQALTDGGLAGREASGTRWRLLSQLIAIGAVATAHNNNEKELIDLVRSLQPYQTAGRGRDSVDGCPVSLAISNNSIEELTADSKVRGKASSIVEQSVLAWGLDFQDAEVSKTVSISGRLASAAGRRDWAGVRNIVRISSISRKTWLKMSAGPDPNADWDDATWSVLFSVALANNQKELAADAWALYSGVKRPDEAPSTRVWNALLSGYARCRDYESMFRTWEQMQAYPGARDWFTRTTLISALFRARQPDQALLSFEEAKHEALLRGQVVPIELCNAVLLGLCVTFRRDEAYAMFERLLQGKEKGMPQPNIVTINTMLRAYGRQGDFEGMTRLLQQLKSLDLTADRFTFTTILDAMSRAGERNVVHIVLDAMTAEGIMPNAVTMTALIKGYMGGAGDVVGESVEGQTVDELDASDAMGPSGRSPVLCDLALQLLHHMEVQGPTPTEVTYTAVMSGLFDNPDSLRECLAEGTVPSPYATARRDPVSRAEQLFAPGDWATRPEAAISLVLLRHLQRRGFAPNRKTYHTLLGGLLPTTEHTRGVQYPSSVVVGSASRAVILLDTMLRSQNALPNWSTWSIVLTGMLQTCNERRHPPETRVQLRSLLGTVLSRYSEALDEAPQGRLASLVHDARALLRQSP